MSSAARSAVASGSAAASRAATASSAARRGRTCKARTPASGTCSLAAATTFGAIQRTFVPYVGASGATPRRPVPASHFTTWACPASDAATARMASNRARTLPLAAGATMPRSVIIIVIAVLSPTARGVTPYETGAAPPRLRRAGAGLLRCLPGGKRELADEADTTNW
ncbi:hypothetical protein [Streptomyces lavendofoliae]|uniref:hypothetical protein n=1 Tax=Streptomyces lavendofoliae TaxID=67314 RepID=UPI003D8FDB6A